jgi:hypothetical protein
MPKKTREEANFEARKLDLLAQSQGLTVESYKEEYVLSEVVPGICMNEHCEYTADVAPGEREGWCEECGTRSVRSGIVLAGII